MNIVEGVPACQRCESKQVTWVVQNATRRVWSCKECRHEFATPWPLPIQEPSPTAGLPPVTEAYPGELAILRADNNRLYNERNRLAVWVYQNANERSNRAAARFAIGIAEDGEPPDGIIASKLAEHDHRAMPEKSPEDRENVNAKTEIPKGDVIL